MLWKKDKLFCDLHPVCYKLSMEKEICKRHLQNRKSTARIAKTRQTTPLPNVVSANSSYLIKCGPGIDLTLQQNKAVNIDLAAQQLNGLLIRPGETFSFWLTVGKTTRRKGYKDGRIIIGSRIRPGLGGGLCNLANSLHLLVLHSPLEVTEFHGHSDALAPDHGPRVPFSAGTSISYNYIDYRFCNTTDQTVQLLTWCENETLYTELRSERPFPYRYHLSEEDHHFHQEGASFYRISKIYKHTEDAETGAPLDKTLVLDNHSRVMFDHDLIPQELIR